MNNAWQQRDIAVREQADTANLMPADLRKALAGSVKRLIGLKRCSPSAVAWFKVEKFLQRHTVCLSANADGRTAREHPAIKVNGLPWMADGALLTVQAVLSDHGGVVSYTAGLSGTLKDSGVPWFARIDLDDQPRGSGPCGHPMLHCHVGADPDQALQARVPLPWLTPAEALEWLLVTVDPALEPPN